MGEEPDAITSGNGRSLNKVYKSYFRAARWSRIAVVAFWILVAVFFVWALPWDPFGMQTSDYSPGVVIALLLLGFSPAVAAISILSRSMAKDRREALAAWSSIYDKATGLRTGDYFMDRLRLQCQLGRELEEYRAGVVLVVIEQPLPSGKGMGPPEDRVFRSLATRVSSQMRPSDLVATVGPGEIAVLVAKAAPASLQIVGERIRRSLDHRLDDLAQTTRLSLMVQMGAASLSECDCDAEALLAAARRSLKVIRIDGRRVAA